MLLLVAAASFVAFAVFAHVEARAELDQAKTEGEDPSASSSPLPSWGAVDAWGITEEAIEANTVTNAIEAGNVGTSNLVAFLAMIGDAEGTNREPDPYRVCYGYKHTIADLSDHPAVTGEWRGEPLDKLGPRYAGKVSTAAGRYQMIRPTWLRAQRALGLVDFGPDSQDAAAAWLIKKAGALDDVLAGYLESAVRVCSSEWASLPGSRAGQGGRSLAFVANAYQSAGGVLA